MNNSLPGLHRRWLLGALMSLSLFAACRRERPAPAGSTLPATAGSGQPVAEGSDPTGTRRVVSLSPSTTEAMAALGGLEQLVGRSRHCDYPTRVQALPVVGGFSDPNYEAIVALRPDLVVGARGPAGPGLTERLAARGVATYFPPTESLADIETMIEGLGVRVGRLEAGRTLSGAMRERRQRLAARAATRPRVRALLLFGTTPIVAAGPGSFTDEMLRLAGGQNVLDGRSGALAAPYPTLGLEQVIALAPEVILDAAVMEHHGQQGLGLAWQAVEAVRQKRVVALDDEAILRPGPRVLDGVEALARALYNESR